MTARHKRHDNQWWITLSSLSNREIQMLHLCMVVCEGCQLCCTVNTMRLAVGITSTRIAAHVALSHEKERNTLTEKSTWVDEGKNCPQSALRRKTQLRASFSHNKQWVHVYVSWRNAKIEAPILRYHWYWWLWLVSAQRHSFCVVITCVVHTHTSAHKRYSREDEKKKQRG